VIKLPWSYFQPLNKINNKKLKLKLKIIHYKIKKILNFMEKFFITNLVNS